MHLTSVFPHPVSQPNKQINCGLCLRLSGRGATSHEGDDSSGILELSKRQEKRPSGDLVVRHDLADGRSCDPDDAATETDYGHDLGLEVSQIVRQP